MDSDIKQQNQELLAKLREGREVYLRIVRGIPEEASRLRNSEDSWSILECAEHVALAERGMMFALQHRRPTDAAPDFARDQMVEQIISDRTRKATAPEPSRPTGRFANLAVAIREFEAARAETLAFIQNNNEDLRKCTVKHPFGIFDAYQVLMIMALHPQRHALQIEEIRRKHGAGMKAEVRASV